MPKFNFNYCKSIFKLFILCLWIKLLLFNYNIQNNLTIIIIYRKMKWRWKESDGIMGGFRRIPPHSRTALSYILQCFAYYILYATLLSVKQYDFSKLLT